MEASTALARSNGPLIVCQYGLGPPAAKFCFGHAESGCRRKYRAGKPPRRGAGDVGAAVKRVIRFRSRRSQEREAEQNMFANARNNDLTIQELGAELLIYDGLTHKTHCL